MLPKCSIIISVYKDIKSLDLILEGLSIQTFLPDEVIISEDGNSKEINEFVNVAKQKYKNLNLIHLFQDDLGWRKNKALNRAIIASHYEYLIFLDGDCVPYPDFVKWHLKLSNISTVLCGRRTEIGKVFSDKLKNRELSIKDFIKSYYKLYFQLQKDNVNHYEEGIFINPKSLLGKIIKIIKDRKIHLGGFNFSCYKSDLIKINGFDEDFTLPTTGEDSDLERRMVNSGITMKSCRHFCNVIHLDHKKVFTNEISSQTLALMESKKDIFICKNGIKKS